MHTRADSMKASTKIRNCRSRFEKASTTTVSVA